jgi:hypothetical protein
MNKKLALTSAVISMLTLAYSIQLTNAMLPEVEESSTDGRIEIWFHSLTTAQSLPFYPHTPETVGYIFAWVDLSIKNVGSEDVHINWNYAYLKDSENYQYRGTHADSPKEFPLMDLPSGETIRGEFYFEVPSEATIEKFIWSDLRSYVSIVIPEFSSILILTLFMITALLAVIVYRRKHSV